MKKLLIILSLSMLCLFGCNNNQEDQPANTDQSTEYTSALSDWHSFREENGYSFDEDEWDPESGTEVQKLFEPDILDSGCVTHPETARQIADAVMSDLRRQGYFTKGVPASYVLFSIRHDKEKNVWLASYAEPDPFPGACMTIAIDGETAAILKIYVE